METGEYATFNIEFQNEEDCVRFSKDLNSDQPKFDNGNSFEQKQTKNQLLIKVSGKQDFCFTFYYTCGEILSSEYNIKNIQLINARDIADVALTLMTGGLDKGKIRIDSKEAADKFETTLEKVKKLGEKIKQNLNTGI
jgi:hypothetical protein